MENLPLIPQHILNTSKKNFSFFLAPLRVFLFLKVTPLFSFFFGLGFSIVKSYVKYLSFFRYINFLIFLFMLEASAHR